MLPRHDVAVIPPAQHRHVTHMNPVRKNMPVQIVPFVTVSRTRGRFQPPSVGRSNLRHSRFSIRSPALQHHHRRP